MLSCQEVGFWGIPSPPDVQTAITAQKQVQRCERRKKHKKVGCWCSKQWQKGSDWVGEEGSALDWPWVLITSSTYAPECGQSLGADLLHSIKHLTLACQVRFFPSHILFTVYYVCDFRCCQNGFTGKQLFEWLFRTSNLLSHRIKLSGSVDSGLMHFFAVLIKCET